jgi:hypothetical protein
MCPYLSAKARILTYGKITELCAMLDQGKKKTTVLEKSSPVRNDVQIGK